MHKIPPPPPPPKKKSCMQPCHSSDVEVGLEMGWLMQQNRPKQGLSQKDLAVVSAWDRSTMNTCT